MTIADSVLGNIITEDMTYPKLREVAERMDSQFYFYVDNRYFWELDEDIAAKHLDRPFTIAETKKKFYIIEAQIVTRQYMKVEADSPRAAIDYANSYNGPDWLIEDPIEEPRKLISVS